MIFQNVQNHPRLRLVFAKSVKTVRNKTPLMTPQLDTTIDTTVASTCHHCGLNMSPLRPHWTPLDPTGPQLTPLDPTGPQLTPLNLNWLHWTSIDLTGLHWTSIDLTGLHWTLLDPTERGGRWSRTHTTVVHQWSTDTAIPHTRVPLPPPHPSTWHQPVHAWCRSGSPGFFWLRGLSHNTTFVKTTTFWSSKRTC